jgi:tRNA uridine 5-carbamoylmethylation protein Kti12
MIETKLIIVTGMSGTGKSTTARYISDLLNHNQIKHTYLHEECEKHPIRSDEFKIGNLKNREDLQKNIEHMFKL